MDSGLCTKADVKLFGHSATIIEKIFVGECYIYQIENNKETYILKGYKICLEQLKPGDNGNKIRFTETLNEILHAFQEYFFYKFASAITEHFAKPLIIDYEVKVASDEFSLSYLCIETIYEYCGVPINELNCTDINLVYSLMKQSIVLLSIIHFLGLVRIDIRPGNMIYNKNTGILKFFDMGRAIALTTTSIKETNDKVKFTPEFAAPEIFSSNEALKNLDASAMDVYSWGMTFYSILLKKDMCALANEMKKYKLGTEETYAPFINSMKIELSKTQESSEQEKFELIKEELCNVLNFKPEKRPKINEIIETMKKFEICKNIKAEYCNHSKKLLKCLLLEEDMPNELIKLGSNPNEEYKTPKSTNDSDEAFIICQACFDKENTKVKLCCNHTVCKKCTVKYIMRKFMKDQYYDHCLFCTICGKLKKVITISMNCGCKWTQLNEKFSNNRISDMCDKGHNFDCIDLYLINDYDWFNDEYKKTCGYINKNPNKSELCIEFGKFGPASAFAISDKIKNSIITKLSLDNNQIGNAGAIILSNAIKTNTTLKMLYLYQNQIGIDGAIAIAKVIEENSSIEELNLGYNMIRDCGAEAIAKALEKNKSITQLNIGQNGIKTIGGIAIGRAIKMNSTLKKLYLYSNKTGPEGISNIAKGLESNLSTIELYLDDNQAGIIGAKAISRALRRNSTIMKISLCENQIEDEGAIDFANSIGQNLRIISVNLYSNKIGPIGADAIVNACKRNLSISELDLRYNKLGDEGALSIAKLIETSAKILKLYLDRNNIGDVGVIEIAKSLEHNTALLELFLDNNNIGVKGASALAKSLESNFSLIQLCLDYNKLGDDGAIKIAMALGKNTSLMEISLRGNSIGDHGANSLGISLQTNTSILTINLSNNNIQNEGINEICKVIKKNKKLNKLGLGMNMIGNEGAKKIANALELNSKLVALDLSSNEIGFEGTSAIIKVLENNSTILGVDLNYNKIDNNDLIALQKQNENHKLYKGKNYDELVCYIVSELLKRLDAR